MERDNKPFQGHYYHGCLRRTLVSFGALFNNIYIHKVDNHENLGKSRTKEGDAVPIIEERSVPIQYGPKEKFVALLSERPNVEEKPNIPLPRMYFELVDLYPDLERKQPTNEHYTTKVTSPNSDSLETVADIFKNYVPAPWNANVQLGVFCRSEDDAWQILEQILPLFGPSHTLRTNMTGDTKEYRDIEIVYNSITKDDQWSGSFTERRYLVYVLSFTVKTYIFGPVRTSTTILDININTWGFDGADLLSPDKITETITNEPYETLFIKENERRAKKNLKPLINLEIFTDFMKYIDSENSNSMKLTEEGKLEIKETRRTLIMEQILTSKERTDFLKEVKEHPYIEDAYKCFQEYIIDENTDNVIELEDGEEYRDVWTLNPPYDRETSLKGIIKEPTMPTVIIPPTLPPRIPINE